MIFNMISYAYVIQTYEFSFHGFFPLEYYFGFILPDIDASLYYKDIKIAIVNGMYENVE